MTVLMDNIVCIPYSLDQVSHTFNFDELSGRFLTSRRVIYITVLYDHSNTD
jgi:hypothetical protein